MSFGKMQTKIKIVRIDRKKDAEGYSSEKDVILAEVMAYKEVRHGDEKWANMAVFNSANALFRFRKIPGLTVTTDMFIVCGGERYNIISVEDVRERGMYVEILAERNSG